MRLIVIGELQEAGDGFMTGTIYMRFAEDNTTRRAVYAASQSQPLAPGDYTQSGADSAEVALITSGSYFEKEIVGGAKFPKGATVADLAPAIEADYQAELASWTSEENLRFAFYRSWWDGSSTVYQSGQPAGWTINEG